MSTPPASTSDAAAPTAQRAIGVTGLTAFFFTLAAVLIFFGGGFLLGARYFDYWTNNPTQATFGLAMLMGGVMFFIAASVLSGVRAMLRQQTEILLASRER